MKGALFKTLIIRFSSVGDIVLSTPLIRSLRQRFPQSQIDYCTRSEYGELLRTNTHLSNLIEFPAGGKISDLRRLRRQLRESRYDLVIDIHDSLRSRLLTFGFPSVRRINKRKLARWILVHLKRDLYDRLGGQADVAHRYIEPVEALGVRDDGEGPELFLPPEAVHRAGEVLREAAAERCPTLLGFCPSARHETKQWPAERFAETASSLARETNAGILLFGSAAERDRCSHIRSRILALAPDAFVLDLSGRLTLMETAAVMDHCALVITNDSGLMHIAAARKRKLVAVFGSTTRQLGFFPPANLGIVVQNPSLACRPCSHIGRSSCPEGHFNCMNGIHVSQVLDAARIQLKH